MIKRTTLPLLLAGLMLLGPTRPATAYQPDYAQDVEFNFAPSPADVVSGSTTEQYGEGQTNSQIDNYVNQDDQLNLFPDSGTVRVLRTNQKWEVNNFVTAFVPLKNVTVRELRGLARTICRKEGGDADVLNDKVRNRNGIVVVCPPHMVPYITQTLQALDHEWTKEWSDGSWYVYYKAKNRDIRNIYNILKFYRTPDAAWAFDDANNAYVYYDQPCIQPLFEKGSKEVDIPPSQILLDVAVYELDAQNDLAIGLDWESWKNGPGADLFRFVAWNFNGDDNGAPNVFPFGSADWGHFRSYDVRFTTAYIDFLQSKGRARLVNKSTLATKSGSLGEIAAVDQVLSFRSNDIAPAVTDLTQPAFYRLSDIWDYYREQGVVEAGLDELVKLDGDDVIDAFRALADEAGLSDAQEAAIVNGLNERNKDGHISRDDLEETPVPVAVLLSVFRNRILRYTGGDKTGVMMTVFPVVGLYSAEVAMALDVSDVNGYTPAGLPIIEHRYLSSQIELKDGQPFVLGGIRRSTTVKSANGIPFLRDIRYLGYLFGREVTTKREKEIVVLITPRFKLCPMDEPNPPKELEDVFRLVKAPVADKAKEVRVPKDAYGFDQYLIDPIAARRMDETSKMH